jgi:hypothetical protein
MVDTKKAYVEKAHARLEELNAKKDEAMADVKIEAGESINAVEKKIGKAKAYLDEISNMAEDKCEEAKGKVEVLTEDVKASIKKLFS